MGLRNVFHWWSQQTSDHPTIAYDDSLMAGQESNVLEPCESTPKAISLEFRRTDFKPRIARNHSSLLTKAINGYNADNGEAESSIVATRNSELTHRRSVSTISPELTSDGATTNSSRPHTPNSYIDEHSLQSMDNKTEKVEAKPVMIKVYPASRKNEIVKTTQADPSSVVLEPPLGNYESATSEIQLQQSTSPCKPLASLKYIEPIIGYRARSISHPHLQTGHISIAPEPKLEGSYSTPPTPPKPRKPTIKFACSGPQPLKVSGRSNPSSAPLTSSGFSSSRSSLGITTSLSNSMTKSMNKTSSTPWTSKNLSPNISNCLDDTSKSSQATGFFEFASEEDVVEEWLRQDLGDLTSKLTINDMLKKENEIRRLASEVEEEELEEVEACRNNSDEEEEEDDEDFDFEFYSSDVGNETDNEAGFADSDESDFERETDIWSPGGSGCIPIGRRPSRLNFSNPIRITHNRSGSNSSIDPPSRKRSIARKKRQLRISKSMRPGTPDLPDSTDFVCGTLDEDQPLEKAYLSCLEARKNARHMLTPQDIDPTFPTSDTEDDDENNYQLNATHSSERQRFFTGKLEHYDNRLSRTLSRNRTLNNRYSPKKFHSPPPPKHRLRSPVKKMFGKSPKRSYPLSRNHVS